MCHILEVFCEKEREYYKKSGAKPMSLDDHSFQIEYSDFSIVGQPDRVDRHPDGLFILDYKSSGTVPHGSEMLEQGYRLQLPFYAVAVYRKTKQPILGVQFVELDRKGTRRNGVFFKQFNGKEPGKLTHVRSNSRSLVNLQPEEAWGEFDKLLKQYGTAYIKGSFEAKPRTAKREKECARCHLADLCGMRRLVEPSGQGSNGQSSGGADQNE
jgi:RecB family exonuclease